MPRSPEEASADLGADLHDLPAVTSRAMRDGAPGRGLLAFALSFDEIIVTNFTAGGGTQTIPMWIFQGFQRLAEPPVVNVAGVLAILLSVIPVYIATRISWASLVDRRTLEPCSRSCRDQSSDGPRTDDQMTSRWRGAAIAPGT